jgi:hypothetical protein
MPTHKHSLTCLDTKSFFKGKGMLCKVTHRYVNLDRGKVSEKWPLPPQALLDLFRQSGKDVSRKTLQAVQRFIAKLPLKDEHDNASAAAHYRKIAARHSRRGGAGLLADAYYEIANQLWN